MRGLRCWLQSHRLGPPTVFGACMEFEGDIVSAGSVQIEGQVTGKVRCHTLEVSGTLHGDVDVRRLIIGSTGRIHGKVEHEELTVLPGGELILVNDAPDRHSNEEPIEEQPVHDLNGRAKVPEPREQTDCESEIPPSQEPTSRPTALESRDGKKTRSLSDNGSIQFKQSY